MRQDVRAFMEKHQLLHRNATVLLGVSGGPDSMALLHFYYSIQTEWNIHIIAISVDHQLRGEESKQDLIYVERMCKQWEIPFEKASVDVQSYKKKYKVSTQVAARNLRYPIFKQKMEQFNADFLVLGHHADDQVETMLMEWMRSAGSNSVLGIPIKRPFGAGHIVRPFLCITKDAILQYCKKNAIFPRIDPSNEDTAYTRNYLRKRVIPLIKERNPNIHQTIQRLSETLQMDESFLQKEAKKLVEEAVVFNENYAHANFPIESFKKYDRSLQRRAFHLILNYLYSEVPAHLSYVHEDIFFTLLETKESNVELDFPRRLKIEKVYEQIVFYFSKTSQTFASTPYVKELRVPGDVVLPNGEKLSTRFTNRREEKGNNTYICSAAAIQLPLIVRTRKAGDRLRLRGLNGSKKLKDLFIDRKIPRKERDRQMLVTDAADEILWVVGLQKADPNAKVENSPYIEVVVTESK
ncbi:tRNA lysidine(34) synthetase TilS [Virgibacillus sp. W0430]|uniref:tRNA lysidine(34) synthetase TilS n=1 Tax=Virgibacillus sp. W0430 TaxID=3391580 RepID=UPI003F476943